MKTIGLITEVNGYPLADKWYESFAIASEEQQREEWHNSWGSSTRHRGEECPRCRGKGATRKDANVGCETCFGMGVIND